MNGTELINKCALFYGAHLPYHPGKWRVIEFLIGTFRLQEFYEGKSFDVKRQNLRWRLWPDCLVQRSVYYLSCYEVKETNWLRDRVKPDWVFFDVGSNFGYYSMLVSQLSHKQARVYAFEPLARNYDLLNDNKALNGFERLETFKLALSNATGETDFLVPQLGNMGHGKIDVRDDGERGGAGSEKVQTTTLDNFVREQGVEKIDFIKVDIEGAEVLFLEGAAETLREFRPLMMMEFNPASLEEFGTSADVLLRMLRALDYKTYRVLANRLEAFEDVKAIEDYCNLICVPEVARDSAA
ncbi:MAG: FkbM family methyltransferase [Acidobacteriota bacterium]